MSVTNKGCIKLWGGGGGNFDLISKKLGGK